jgi:DDE superfamily endonuclease
VFHTLSPIMVLLRKPQYTKKQYWYSGKHKRHGGAVQTVAAPDGELLWVSGVLPGRTVDITAARRFKIADKVLEFLGLLADLGYIGLHPDIITGYKRKRGEKTLSEAKKAANRTQASLRCLGERANAQLKSWRVLACDFRGSPRQLTTVVKAVQTLQCLIRDPFGIGRIDTVS